MFNHITCVVLFSTAVAGVPVPRGFEVYTQPERLDLSLYILGAIFGAGLLYSSTELRLRELFFDACAHVRKKVRRGWKWFMRLDIMQR